VHFLYICSWVLRIRCQTYSYNGPKYPGYLLRLANQLQSIQLQSVWSAGDRNNGGIIFYVERTSPFRVMPGPGLARLTAIRYLSLQDVPGACINSDLAFLSSLTCAGGVSGPRRLTSLTGLDNVVDGFISNSETVFYYPDSINLTNVSALNAYARCGTATQRPDSTPAVRACCAAYPVIKIKGCTDFL
jgi:hypothetical protein